MKRLLCMLLTLVVAFTLFGCSKAPSEPATTGSAATNEATQTTQAAAGAEETPTSVIPQDLPAKKVAALGAFSGNELYL